MLVYFCQVKRRDGAPCTLPTSHKGKHSYCGHEEDFPEPVVVKSMKQRTYRGPEFERWLMLGILISGLFALAAYVAANPHVLALP